MCARRKLAVLKDRTARSRRGADHGGLLQNRGRIRRTLDRQSEPLGHFGGEPLGSRGVRIENPRTADRAHAADGLQLRPSLHACAEHRGDLGILTGQAIGGYAGGGAGPQGRERRAVHDGQRRARRTVGHDDQRLDQWQPLLRIPTEERHHLQAEELPVGRMTRHEECHAMVARRVDAHSGRDRNLAAGELHECLAHRGNGVGHRQRLADFGGGEVQQRRCGRGHAGTAFNSFCSLEWAPVSKSDRRRGNKCRLSLRKRTPLSRSERRQWDSH